MHLKTLTSLLENKPSEVEFQDIMSLIESLYDYTPTEFANGIGEDKIINPAGTNEGSCKLFAFASDQKFTKQQTLDCFGNYYRNDVLLHPENTDHANIRNFIKYGWEGILFSSNALSKKQ